MTIVITEWALQAYTDRLGGACSLMPNIGADSAPMLNGSRCFLTIRNSQFELLGAGADRSKKNVPDGYKMKWHNIGPGKNQLRLAVALINGNAYLCQAYVKNNAWVNPTNAAY